MTKLPKRAPAKPKVAVGVYLLSEMSVACLVDCVKAGGRCLASTFNSMTIKGLVRRGLLVTVTTGSYLNGDAEHWVVVTEEGVRAHALIPRGAAATHTNDGRLPSASSTT